MDAERLDARRVIAAPPKLEYVKARGLIVDGDVLLFRGSRGPFSAAIRWATRSRYSHAALAVWANVGGTERLMVAESRELRGCRLVPLSVAVRGCFVDAYRVSLPVGWDPGRMLEVAVERLGGAYGWAAILKDAVGRLPVLALLKGLGVLRRIPVLGRWLDRLPFGHSYSEDDLEDPGGRVKCSTYVALCYRAGGLDLVPNLADRSTDPGDLARSAVLSPLWELVP